MDQFASETLRQTYYGAASARPLQSARGWVRVKRSVFAADVSLRWAKIGARLVPANVDTGYLVYVDDGYLVGIEGHTYGAEWPAQMDEFNLYDLRNGMKPSRART